MSCLFSHFPPRMRKIKSNQNKTHSGLKFYFQGNILSPRTTRFCDHRKRPRILIRICSGFAMGSNQNLPFKIGQLAESKSFESGFRGAWFRCKIKDIRKIKGHIIYSLEFFDFPDEKLGRTKLYQMPPHRVSHEERKLHLMVRPSFPSIYHESQMPDNCKISEVIAIVDDDWKVGDLVDWLYEGCYWSGRITHLLGEDKAKIKLPDEPVGEGNCYEASCKDLRPSVDWSPERGWTVPISSGSEAFRYCARLVRPANRETGINIGPTKEVPSLDSSDTSISSHGSVDTSPSQLSSYPPKETPKQVSGYVPNEETHRPCAITGLDLGDIGMRKLSSSDGVSSTHSEQVSAAIDKPPGTNDRYKHDMRVSGQDVLNSSPDTVESSILDLEELVNKIRWLKRVHQFGPQDANAMTPSWKFLEDGASSTRR